MSGSNERIFSLYVLILMHIPVIYLGNELVAVDFPFLLISSFSRFLFLFLLILIICTFIAYFFALLWKMSWVAHLRILLFRGKTVIAATLELPKETKRNLNIVDINLLKVGSYGVFY